MQAFHHRTRSSLEFRLNRLLGRTETLLERSAQTGKLGTALQGALGQDPESEAVREVLAFWLAGGDAGGDWGLPPVQLSSPESMAGAAGAYVAGLNVILINEQFLATATDEEVIRVLAEEYGHFLDQRLNLLDTPGDEGERFAGVLLAPSGQELAALQSGFDDDTITVSVGGSQYTAEAAMLTGTTTADFLYDLSKDPLAGALNGAADSISSLEGNDTLDGGVGSVYKDTLAGGSGSDLYFADYFDVIQEAPSTVSAEVDTIRYRNYAAYEGYGFYLPDNVENLEARFTNTTISGGENLGTAGFNTAGRAVLVGNALANRITGTDLNDVLRTDGSTKENTNAVASPRDTLIGGLGDDEYQVFNSNATLVEGTNGGYDVVFYLSPFYAVANGAAVTNYVLAANVEEARLDPNQISTLSITGNALGNTITGNKGSNSLRGGDGNDLLIGGPDGSSADFFDGGTGTNTITYISSFTRTPVVVAQQVAAASFAAFSSKSGGGATSTGSDPINKPGNGNGSGKPGVKNGYVSPPPDGIFDAITNFQQADKIVLEFMPNTAPSYWTSSAPWVPLIYAATSDTDYPTADTLNAWGFNLYFNPFSGALMAVYDITSDGNLDLVPIAIVNVPQGGNGFDLTADNFSFLGNTVLSGPGGKSPFQINQAPSISVGEGTVLGTVIEDDANNVVSGTLAASDLNPGQQLTWTVVGNPANPYGTFSLDASGNWTFALNNASSSVQALNAGQTVDQKFTVKVTDEFGATNTTTIVVTIQGVNDAPTLAPVLSATYTDTAANDSFTPLTGTLAGADVDSGASLTYGLSGATVSGGTATLAGAYGTLVLNTSTGGYTYTPNAGAINALTADAIDSFTFTVSDGTATTSTGFTVNLKGANDTALITVPTPEAISASVSEDAANPTLTASGSLQVADADAGQGAFSTPVTGAAGTLGNLTITASGAWNYTVPNSSVQYLGAGQSKNEVFTVTSLDGSSSQTITITINGVNDVPVISGTSSGTVIEAGSATAGVSSVSGALNATDADLGDILSWSVVGTPSTTYGTFSFNSANGSWSYALDNSLAATQGLLGGASVQQSYTLRVQDGTVSTNQQVMVTIQGSNDSPFIRGTSASSNAISLDLPYTSNAATPVTYGGLNLATWSTAGDQPGIFSIPASGLPGGLPSGYSSSPLTISNGKLSFTLSYQAPGSSTATRIADVVLDQGAGNDDSITVYQLPGTDVSTSFTTASSGSAAQQQLLYSSASADTVMVITGFNTAGSPTLVNSSTKGWGLSNANINVGESLRFSFNDYDASKPNQIDTSIVEAVKNFSFQLDKTTVTNNVTITVRYTDQVSKTFSTFGAVAGSTIAISSQGLTFGGVLQSFSNTSGIEAITITNSNSGTQKFAVNNAGFTITNEVRRDDLNPSFNLVVTDPADGETSSLGVTLRLDGTDAGGPGSPQVWNEVVGTSGADTLSGTAQNDRIRGRLGADTLTGAAGSDAFLYVQGDGATLARDTLTDFVKGTDLIRVEASAGFTVTGILSSNADGNAATNDWRITATFTGGGTTVSETYDLLLSGTTTLALDPSRSDSGALVFG